MAQQKFITSHGFRVKRANDYRKKSPEKISIIDREALVEFYLLEDIERLYLYRLDRNIKKSATDTKYGKISGRAAQNILRSTLYLVKSAIEVSKNKIDIGRYSDVWKAIPEGALMRAASNMNYLDKMKEMLGDLLGELSPEALDAVQKVIDSEEELNDLEAHEANVRALRGWTEDEFNQIVNPSETDVIDENGINKNKNDKNKPNLN